MTKTQLTENEIYSCISEFWKISIEMMALNGLFHKKISNLPQDNLAEGLSQFDFEIGHLQDAAIIRLVRLYNIQPLLGQILKEKTDHGTQLLQILSPVWKLITSDERKIRKIWRNRLIAHSEEQVKNYKSYYELDAEYLKTFESVFTALRAEPLYYRAIRGYAKPLFDETRIYITFGYEKPPSFRIKTFWNKLNADEKHILSETNLKLRKNGFEEIEKPDYKDIF